MPPTLSKSKYLAGLQCPKLLWTHYNDRYAIPPPDAARQAIFDAGHEVGDLAKRPFPGGIEVPWSRDLDQTVAATADLLPRRVPLFEAAFLSGGCYCAVDILVPVAGGAWDLYEVKSTASVKDVHVDDVAFQAEVVEGAGLTLDRLFVVHLDTGYVRDGAIDPAGLLRAIDITEQACARRPAVAGSVAAMQRTIAGPRPDTPIGPHCSRPYDCDLWPVCSAFLPEHNVLDLYYLGKKKAFTWIDAGRPAIADLPPADLNPMQRIQQRTVQTGRPHVSPADLRTWLTGLEYPLYCLDFETVGAAVPLLDGTRPYQQVPFQLSLHIVDGPGVVPVHIEYLADTPADPRPGLVSALATIGPVGTILAYNMSFERRVIADLADAFPAAAHHLRALHGRFQDLMTPFRAFWYHHPGQRGSCSLKSVLPALTGTTYDGLDIAEGGQAQREFQRVVFGDVDPAEKDRVLAALRDYCRQDTQALVDILEVLRGVV